MYTKILYSLLFVSGLLLVGCADAGDDKNVNATSEVVLEGNTSTTCVGGEIKKYKWQQISGTDVEIDNDTRANINFIAPDVSKETRLIFSLKTIEEGGHPDYFVSYDFVMVTVQPSDDNDTIAPVITLIGDVNMTLNVDDTYIEQGATAIDDVDGEIDVNITGTVDTEIANIYTITYTATDSNNNTATAQRKVTVVEDDNNETNVTADIQSVSVSGEESKYRFAVALKSSDINCTQYADWWEVLSEDGELLYRRVLGHSHANEQPFTRSGGAVNIQKNQTVYIRAHMNTTGYAGNIFVGTVETQFTLAEHPPIFSDAIEQLQPLPTGCAF